jgi:hypothetical protein
LKNRVMMKIIGIKRVIHWWLLAPCTQSVQPFKTAGRSGPIPISFALNPSKLPTFSTLKLPKASACTPAKGSYVSNAILASFLAATVDMMMIN